MRGHDSLRCVHGIALARLVVYVSLVRSCIPSLAAAAAAAAAAHAASPTTIASLADGRTELTMHLLEKNRYRAKCLDGSPPGYFFRRGFGSGSSAWHVHLPFGGWCGTVDSCAARARTYLGSSDANLQLTHNPMGNSSWGYTGILSVNARHNPLLFNWNLVVPMYCDGSGFAGRAGRIRKPGGGTTIYSNGWKIFKAVVADVTSTLGFASASRVLLSGTSAGAQAVVTLCDQLPSVAQSAVVKCLMDSGFFLDIDDRHNRPAFRLLAQNLSSFHDVIGNPLCSRSQPPSERWRCFFPQYALRFVRSPVFIANSLFDLRALVLGNHLNDSGNHAKQCLYPLASQPGVLQLLQARMKPEIYKEVFSAEVVRLAGSTSRWCAREEVEAVMRSGRELWRFVGMLTSRRLRASLPLSTQHSLVGTNSWNTFQADGKALRASVEEWLVS